MGVDMYPYKGDAFHIKRTNEVEIEISVKRRMTRTTVGDIR